MDFISENNKINNQIDITTLKDDANINIPEGTSVEIHGIGLTPIAISKQNGIVDLSNTSMSEPSIQWQSDDELVLNLYQGRAAIYRNLFFKNIHEKGCKMPIGLTRISEKTIPELSLVCIAKYLEKRDGISEIHTYNNKLCCTDGFVWFRMTPRDNNVYIHTYFEAGRPGGSHWNCREYHGELFYEYLREIPME
jgi:hypothetical protein